MTIFMAKRSKPLEKKLIFSTRNTRFNLSNVYKENRHIASVFLVTGRSREQTILCWHPSAAPHPEHLL